MTLSLEIVDVFAERSLEGNPLAVVRGAARLAPERMQAMAREMNFSETTFVTRESPGRARVRIFTPLYELPFAGHPTLGTAWVLTRGEADIEIELEAGPVPVRFEDGIAWMKPPQPEMGGALPREDVAAWLGTEPARIAEGFGARLGTVGGADFLLVGLDAPSTLETFSIDLEKLRALPARHLFVFVPVVEEEESSADCGASPHRYRARMFFEAGGVREDPATGSANAVFAEALRSVHGAGYAAVVDQGVEMGRPSRLYLSGLEDGLRIGGRVQPVARGEWCLEGDSLP